MMEIKILRFVFVLASLLFLAACSSTKFYSVSYKNLSEQKVHKLQGLWGEECIFFLPIAYVRGMAPDAVRSPGKMRGDVTCDIPEQVGGRWVNDSGELVESWVSIDTQLIPKLGRTERYLFIVSVVQDEIHQVEVVIRDSNKLRQKRNKVMLYCASSDGCLFNSPFTTDTYYDCENLTPEQLSRLREESARRRAIGFGEQIREDLRERGIELEEYTYIENCPAND